MSHSTPEAKKMVDKVTSHITDTLESAKSSVVDTVDSVTASASDNMKSVKDAVVDQAEKTAEKISGYAGDIKNISQKDVEEAYTATIDTVTEYSKDIAALVKKYPLQSLAIGVVAGWLLCRSTRT